MRPRISLVCFGIAAGLTVSGSALGALTATATPPGLDLLMGAPLMPVPDDGMPIGSVYGHPPSLTPGSALATPIGPMGFGPSHERVSAGTPTSSGAFHALTTSGPIAGSTVLAPVGATAIDFFIFGAMGSAHVFEITAVGTLTSSTIMVVTGPAPVYVGFGAAGESIMLLSIVKMPFPSPTAVTWVVDDIRVLPAPGALALLAGAGLLGVRRRSRASA